nr:cytochrome P450 [Streptomyces sp. NBC_00272]
MDPAPLRRRGRRPGRPRRRSRLRRGGLPVPHAPRPRTVAGARAVRPRAFTGPDGRPTRPGAYLPFGIGPRACLGLQFALRESTVLLEHLLPAHSPVLHSVPAKAAYSITVRPDGPVPATLTT